MLKIDHEDMEGIIDLCHLTGSSPEIFITDFEKWLQERPLSWQDGIIALKAHLAKGGSLPWKVEAVNNT